MTALVWPWLPPCWPFLLAETASAVTQADSAAASVTFTEAKYLPHLQSARRLRAYLDLGCHTLQAEMSGSPDTAAILEALNSQRADARERQAAMERQIREEARRLRGGIAGTL